MIQKINERPSKRHTGKKNYDRVENPTHSTTGIDSGSVQIYNGAAEALVLGISCPMKENLHNTEETSLHVPGMFHLFDQ